MSSTEDEQLADLKDWWTRNGKPLVTGGLLALVIVFGWQAFQKYQSNQSQGASVLYQQLLDTTLTPDGKQRWRVRLARALLMAAPRLALLDEPFRGMDRNQRHALLAEARDFPRPDYEFCDIVGTGGDGLNTYRFAPNSGNDTIRAVSQPQGTSPMGGRIEFGAGVSPDQVTVYRDHDHLVLQLADGSSCSSHFSLDDSAVEMAVVGPLACLQRDGQP